MIKLMSTVSEQELAILNFYRASELHGGLILGEVARRARDGDVASQLLMHSAEEIVHARLWNDAIIAVGGTVRPVKATYQTRFAEALGHPTGLLQVLALTQVFERRVHKHFLQHYRRPGTHPFIRSTLRRMIDDEQGHLSWVKHWLDAQTTRSVEVRGLMRSYTELDATIYRDLTLEFGWSEAA
jgi:demethoxyubiquinone hydroxylase (CLK1/Coq7/Cat5 family)